MNIMTCISVFISACRIILEIVLLGKRCVHFVYNFDIYIAILPAFKEVYTNSQNLNELFSHKSY